MNNERMDAIDTMFFEATCRVREISGISSFEYPEAYISFYRKALAIDSWDRENGDWMLMGGANFVQELMSDLSKRELNPHYVPIAQYRDSTLFAFLSIEDPNYVFIVNPYAPDEALCCDGYTLEEFLNEIWNSHYW